MEVNKISMNKIERKTLVKEYLSNPEINKAIKLNLEVIEKLRLKEPMTRAQRRKIARNAKMDWDMYRLLERETIKRVKANVNLETGEPI